MKECNNYLTVSFESRLFPELLDAIFTIVCIVSKRRTCRWRWTSIVLSGRTFTQLLQQQLQRLNIVNLDVTNIPRLEPETRGCVLSAEPFEKNLNFNMQDDGKLYEFLVPIPSIWCDGKVLSISDKSWHSGIMQYVGGSHAKI